jgi:hypothetical protein
MQAFFLDTGNCGNRNLMQRSEKKEPRQIWMAVPLFACKAIAFGKYVRAAWQRAE